MKTNSWAFPNIFNVAQNKVEILEDDKAVTNRVKCLILTEPTEIYNVPDQGVGLRRYLWQYNTPELKGIIVDRIKEQLRLHEPYVVPDNTQYVDGNLFTGSKDTEYTQSFNRLEMTVSIETKFGTTSNILFNGGAF